MGWISLTDADGPFGPYGGQTDPFAAAPGSDCSAPARTALQSDLLECGSVVAEFQLPADTCGPLLRFDRMCGWQRHLSFDLLAGGTLRLRHRQGGSQTELLLGIAASDQPSLLRLTYGWNAPQRFCTLTAETIDDGNIRQIRGSNPLPMPVDDAIAMAASKRMTATHPGMIWFGVARGNDTIGIAPCCTGATPILTPSGYQRIDSLGPGDLISTLDNGPMPLLGVSRHDLPARGSFAPLLLRSPYFGNRIDLFVAAQQRVALAGAEVEYLFGEDEVLVEARHLVNGQSALWERPRPMVRYYSLLLDGAAVIDAAGCRMECASPSNHEPALGQLHPSGPGGVAAANPAAPTALSRPVLRSYEAIALQAMREHQRNPIAA